MLLLLLAMIPKPCTFKVEHQPGSLLHPRRLHAASQANGSPMGVIKVQLQRLRAAEQACIVHLAACLLLLQFVAGRCWDPQPILGMLENASKICSTQS